MTKKVKPVPEGFHAVTPYLTVERAAEVIDFLKRTFNATETNRITYPDGAVMHAELRIGDSIIMLGDVHCDMKPMPAALYVYVEDPDAAYDRAIQAGATSLNPPADQFYGDRQGGVQDSAGNIWWMAKRIEELSPEEMKQRAEQWMRQNQEMAAARG